jgi:hypothetical protein
MHARIHQAPIDGLLNTPNDLQDRNQRLPAPPYIEQTFYQRETTKLDRKLTSLQPAMSSSSTDSPRCLAIRSTSASERLDIRARRRFVTCLHVRRSMHHAMCDTCGNYHDERTHAAVNSVCGTQRRCAISCLLLDVHMQFNWLCIFRFLLCENIGCCSRTGGKECKQGNSCGE